MAKVAHTVINEFADQAEERSIDILFEDRSSAADETFIDGDQLAVEQFMQAYYRTAMVVSTTSELLLQHFNEDIIQSKKGRKAVALLP